MSNLVIGSGPAGVACAAALLAQGESVTMIDAGLDLEPENALRVRELAAKPPQLWDQAATAFLREGMEAEVEGIPLKLAYGSDYPYRLQRGATEVRGNGINTKFSMAYGGLSTVWGASAMPYRQQDIENWPVSAQDLAPHYRAVLTFMPLAARRDGLATLFPLHKETPSPAPLSAQAAATLGHWQKHEPQLHAAKVWFGQSRLALNASGKNAAGPCTSCGLCMYGCPYGLIYSSANTVNQLRALPRFEYRNGWVVRRVRENASAATVEAISRDGEKREFSADRIFLAAGVLTTTSILLRSLERFEQTVKLRDSHYFLLPALRMKSVPGFTRGNLHTLAQLYLEIVDEAVSDRSIHLQFYTYNDLFEPPIRKMLGPAQKLFPWNAFLSRLMLFQGYLHSDYSPQLQGMLRREGDGDVFELQGVPAPESDAVLMRLISKLKRLRGALGMLPLTPLLRRGDPGRGFHTGGSFPMHHQPDASESDIYGRPAGFRRIHAVDSTILPSIPATTITFTAMANAHRIGTIVSGGQ
jgi:choline dehydrogenase-like flavoprotein